MLNVILIVIAGIITLYGLIVAGIEAFLTIDNENVHWTLEKVLDILTCWC